MMLAVDVDKEHLVHVVKQMVKDGKIKKDDDEAKRSVDLERWFSGFTWLEATITIDVAKTSTYCAVPVFASTATSTTLAITAPETASTVPPPVPPTHESGAPTTDDQKKRKAAEAMEALVGRTDKRTRTASTKLADYQPK